MNVMKERQAWCCLQVKVCDPCLSALDVPWCEKALYKYSSFTFLSGSFCTEFQFSGTCYATGHSCVAISVAVGHGRMTIGWNSISL